MPRRVTAWLTEMYPNISTRRSYYTSLKFWLKYIYGKDSFVKYIGHRYGRDLEIVKRNVEKRISDIEDGIEKYFSELDDRIFIDDYKGFLRWMETEGYAGLTIRHRACAIRFFFGLQDKRCKIEDKEFEIIKRTLIPQSKRASTKDDILTKDQLKTVLKYASFHGRAMALFLLSTGARVGASCQLLMEDIHLYDDPPWVDIKEEYTKGKVGGRIMFFSYEARDAILEWHEDRKNRLQAGGAGPFITGPEAGPKDLVFNYTPKNFTDHWNRILVKADRGRKPAFFSRRDTSTKKRIHVYHPHALRKFFRTNMGVEGSYKGQSGIPPEIVHAYIGHKGYLSEYERLTRKGMANIYKDNMHIVTINEDTLALASVAIKDEEIKELKAEIARLKEVPIDEDALAKRLLDKIMKQMNQKDTQREE